MEANKANPAQAATPAIQASNVPKIFWASVKAQIGGNRKHGWGQVDSLNVIDELIAESCDAIARDKGASPELLAAIGEVINPSAFRQKLESKKVNLLDEAKSERVRKNADLYAGLTE